MQLEAAVERFLAAPSLSEGTRRAYRVDVRQFAGWLRGRSLELDDIDVRVLSDYASELGRGRGRGRPKLAPATVARKLAAVRSFLRFSLGRSRVPDVPLAPRRPRRLPDTLRSDDVDALVDRLDAGDPLGLRNRALVELV